VGEQVEGHEEDVDPGPGPRSGCGRQGGEVQLPLVEGDDLAVEHDRDERVYSGDELGEPRCEVLSGAGLQHAETAEHHTAPASNFGW